MRVGIFSGDAAGAPPERLLDRGASTRPSMAGAALAEQVATDTAIRRAGGGGEALHRRRGRPRHQGDDAADDGRARHRGARAARHGDDRRRPGRSAPDGVFFSNGPGDPATAEHRGRAAARRSSTTRIPYFGICFGNQLLGRALGFGTYKLKYGHRGINQPVMDRTHRQGRGHRAQPRLRRRRAARPRQRHARTAGSGSQPRLPQRRRRRGPGVPRRPGASPCSTTRRPRPARTTPHTSSTASST